MREWNLKQRRARLALPEETPALSKPVEPTFISRISPPKEVSFTLSAPKPKPTMTIIDDPSSKVRPLVSTNFPRLPYRPVSGVRNVRLW